MPAHKIGNLLSTPGELKTLYGKAQHFLRLQQVFSESAPPSLARASRIKNYRKGTLFILADNAAVAAKLRQLAPRLLVNIQKLEPQITGIQVAVQVTGSQGNFDTTLKNSRLGIDSIEKFSKLSEAIPDSPLKSALANLVRHHTRKG